MPPASRGPALDPYLFYAGRFTRDAARWMMAVLAVIYLAHIGIANTQIGIIFGASLAGGFLLSVVVMLTSRAVPTRVWAIVQMLITGLAGIVLIYSSDLWLLIIGGFFGSYAASGAHLGGMSQLEQTGIAAVIPQEGRTKAYSILTMSSAAGRATGALLAGLSTLRKNADGRAQTNGLGYGGAGAQRNKGIQHAHVDIRNFGGERKVRRHRYVRVFGYEEGLKT